MLNICDRVEPDGVIVQFGGQTPLNLARASSNAGVPIIGTSVDTIEDAEDREKFKNVLHRLGLKQPASGIARTMAQARNAVAEIGYPVLVRPSYVLGGRAMEIGYDARPVRALRGGGLHRRPGPAGADRPLPGRRHRGGRGRDRRRPAGDVGRHHGAHRGGGRPLGRLGLRDSAVQPAAGRRGRKSARPPCALATRLQVKGLMNVQFAVKREEGRPNVYVLEVNPRASRTVPFVSKATGMPLAKVAAKVMAGVTLAEQGYFEEPVPRQFSVKEAVFPFAKFAGIDTILGPEMKSTGEVMGISESFSIAFAKSQLAAGTVLPTAARCFSALPTAARSTPSELGRRLTRMGFDLLATRGTAQKLQAAGIDVQLLMKVQQGHPNVLDYMIDGNLQLVFNTPSGKGAGPTKAASAPPPSRTASPASPPSKRLGRHRRHGNPPPTGHDRPSRPRPLPRVQPCALARAVLTRYCRLCFSLMA